MKALKVLNVNQTEALVGGSDVYWSELSSLLRNNGHEVVEFYSAESDLKFPKKIDFSNPRYIDYIKYVYNLESARKISNFLDGIDIVHLNIYYGQLTSSMLLEIRKRGIPVVQTLHEYKLVCPVYTMFREGRLCRSCAGGKFYNALVHRCNRGSVSRSMLSMVEQYVSHFNGAADLDQYIAVSFFQKKLLIEMGVDEKNINVIHNFIDAEQFLPEAFTGSYFLYFGRLEEVKGLGILLRAIRHIKVSSGVDVPLKIVGAGSYEGEARKYSVENNLDKVDFLGFRSKGDLKAIIADAIASVVPSIWPETFGLTVVESLAYERACIVSDIGGMSEIISDGVDGFVVEAGNEFVLADKIKYFLDDLAFAKKMGKAGRKKVLNKFSGEAHIAEIEGVYKRALGL